MTENDKWAYIELATAVRREIVNMVNKTNSDHPGGSLSPADVVTVLFKKYLTYDASRPDWELRDRFVLSKGHAAPLLYAMLALCGYFPLDTLTTFRQLGSPLQGHPDCRKTTGVEISTGSLGQGLSIACGMALGARTKGQSWRTYCLLGDGEMQEGQVWEAVMTASHYKLDKLTAIVDNNGLQIDGKVDHVMNIYPIDKKFEAFGWHTLRIDGHDYSQIESAFENAQHSTEKPSVIIAETTKGKGISYMENRAESHHWANLSEELVEQANTELNAVLKETDHV